MRLKIKLQEQHTTIASLEQLCCVKEDLHSLCEELIRLREFHKSIQNHVYAALQNASEFLVIEGKETLSGCQEVDKLVDNIEETEV